MVQENNYVKDNSSNLQIPDTTLADIGNGNSVSSGNRKLTREKSSLGNVVQMHQQLQASNKENWKLTKKKTFVLQSYSNSRSFIPTSTILANKRKEKKFFPPTHFLYVLISMVLFCFPIYFCAVYHLRKYSHRSIRIEECRKFTEIYLLEIAGPIEKASVAVLS